MKKILVYCETNNNKILDVSYELITKAYQMKEQACTLLKFDDFKIEAVALSNELYEEDIKKIYKSGADRFVFIKEQSLEKFCQTTYAQCFLDYYKDNHADYVLFPATLQTRSLAPRITTYLNTGLVADCIGLEFIVKDNNIMLASTRPTFGAELMATILSKKNPQCATVRPKTFKAVFDKSADGEYYEFIPNSYHEPRIKLLKQFIDTQKEKLNLDKAKIVFCAGYGIVNGKDDSYIKKLEHITKELNINLACTRKLVDMGFLPHEYQIGQTGTTVACDLYIGFGVSGAIQHACGMKNCKKIVAINTDENAEIFNYCDYKITDDAKKIIDELMKKSKNKKKP